MARRSAQVAMATVIWPIEVLLVDPLEDVVGDVLEGRPRTRASASVRSAMASCPADGVGLAGQALEGDPVRAHALDQVALRRRGLGEVLGPDQLAQLGEVVAQRLGG